jgi:hypothetical protein
MSQDSPPRKKTPRRFSEEYLDVSWINADWYLERLFDWYSYPICARRPTFRCLGAEPERAQELTEPWVVTRIKGHLVAPC